MRVLIFSQHFTPEVTAARFRIEPFVEALLRSGHQVEVVCAVPNHPEGVIHPQYRGRALVRKRAPGLTVDYVWVRATPVKTLRTRLGLYGSYAAMAVAVGIGVSNGDQAAEVAAYADGVIVGSAFVRALLDHPGDEAAGLDALRALTADLAEGVRRGTR
jgi:hypothetical protein